MKIFLTSIIALGLTACTPSNNSPEYTVSSIQSTATEFSFGEDLAIGAKVADQIFTFTKSANEATADSTVQLSTVDNAFLLLSSVGCNRTLAKATDKCLVKVRFNATKVSGEHTGTLSVGSGAGTFNIALSASVQAPPEIPEEPVQGLGYTIKEGAVDIESALPFGELEPKKTVQKIITVTNTSTKAISPNVMLTGDTSHFLITSNGCVGALQGKKVCYIKLAFKSDNTTPATTEEKTANLKVVSSTVVLSGSLKSQEAIAQDPETVPASFKFYESTTELAAADFGLLPWGATPSKVLTLKNEGGTAGTPIVTNTGADFSTTITGCVNLRPGASCFVRLYAKAQQASGTGTLGLAGTSISVPLSYTSTPPNTPPTPPNVLVSVSAGSSHTCGIATDNKAYCWGGGDYGQLGNGSPDPSYVPVAVAGTLTFTSISAGFIHTCGIATDNKAYCWGSGGFGRLGNGDTADSFVPVAVGGALSFTSISAGSNHTCGIATDNNTYCWGHGSFGQLGNGGTSSSNIPVAVGGALSFTSISAGSYHNCGIATDNKAYCWGSGDYGKLGNGGTARSLVPVAVDGALSFTSISADDYHTCGITTDDQAYCWGNADYGQLGNGGTSSSNIPVAVSGGLTFTSISAGSNHTCGIATDNKAYCWGSGDSGQLGHGGTTSSYVPVEID